MKTYTKGLPVLMGGDGRATGQVTPGLTLETLRFHLSGTTFNQTHIQRVQFFANTKKFADLSGVLLQHISSYRGLASSPQVLDLPFADLSMQDSFSQLAGCFDTSLGTQVITYELTIVGATNPVVTPILIQTPRQTTSSNKTAAFAGLVSKLVTYPYSIAAGGKLPVVLPWGPTNGTLIKRVHICKSTGADVDAVEVKMNGITVFDLTYAQNEFEQTLRGLSPYGSTRFTLDFVPDGSLASALDTRAASSMEWMMTFGAASSGTIVVEALDALGNLG